MKSSIRTYNLFLSHAWRYHDDYDRLVGMLNAARLFSWKNYSVPRHDPLIDPSTRAGDRRLKEELDGQISPTSSVLILSGMYAAFSYWIDIEIEIARSYDKPIVGVVPWGQERVPVAVQRVATEMVRWHTESVVNAIRKWSR